MKPRLLVLLVPAVLALVATGAAADGPSFDDGILEIDVPVQLVTVGFDDLEVAALAEHLTPVLIADGSFDFNQVLPLALEEGVEGSQPNGGRTGPLPIRARAVFDLVPAPDQLVTDLAAELPGWRLPDPPNLASPIPTYDGSALESWLAARLPADGFTFEPDTPGLVMLNAASLGFEFHRWVYELPTSQVPVRYGYFGEREPFAIIDLNHDDMEATAEFVRGAVRYRVLQGSLYRPSLRPCHALTLVVGMEPSPELEGVLDPRAAEDLFDAGAIRAIFQEVTGTIDVRVDTKVLALPMDDPVLDAMARGEYQTLEAQRWWIHENWERYWVAHEGCEAYVSFLVYRENTPGARIVNGIATWDESKGARISFSWDSEIAGAARGEPAAYNFVRYLLTHESGHLFGLRHPHDVTGADGCSAGDSRFSAIHSAMSYESAQGSVGFSAMDRNNLQRNRAAYMLAAAAARGLEGAPEWDEAMEHIAAYRWLEAGDALSAGVNAVELPPPVGAQPTTC